MLIDWFSMQANPNKFQAIGVGKRTLDLSIGYVMVVIVGLDNNCLPFLS